MNDLDYLCLLLTVRGIDYRRSFPPDTIYPSVYSTNNHEWCCYVAERGHKRCVLYEQGGWGEYYPSNWQEAVDDIVEYLDARRT